MSFMRIPIRTTFNFRVDFERRVVGLPLDDDGWGEASGDVSFVPYLQNVPCLYWFDVRRSGGEQEEPHRISTLQFLRLAIPNEIPVRESDRIVRISDRRDNPKITRVIEILSIMKDHYHQLILTEERH